MINVGREHAGELVNAGKNHLPITTINRDGFAKMDYGIFKKFKEELYVDNEQLTFEKNK